MADKLDFMNELAKSVDAKKHGQTSSFGTIDDFVPARKAEPAADEDPEEAFDIPFSSTSSSPVVQEEPEEGVREVRTAPAQIRSEGIYDNGGDSPASFAKEERVKVEKKQFKPSGGMIAGFIGLLLLIAFLFWFFLLRASIRLPDFTGKTLSEVSSWAAQHKIESTSIARTYQFSNEYASDVVISQTPEGGKNIRRDTPITFIVSQGADPDEPIAFPDIRSMTYDELNDWKNENKLTKTKITTEYSTAVENGGVISYELKNVSEGDFVRGSTLTIRCSKGPAPAGQVTVENFKGKTYTEALTWANSKKLSIVRQDVNSETVENGYIIEQTPAAGQSLSEGDAFTVTVSKGKGVKIPNLVGYTKEQLEAWQSGKNNNVTVVKRSVHNEAPLGSVIAQDTAPGTILDAGDVLQITVSLYMPILETNSRAWLGKDYLELRAWCDDVNYNGADIQAGSWGEWATPTCSDEFPTPGQVVAYACYYGTSDLADGCGRPLNNNSRINYQISSGACTVATPTPGPTPEPTVTYVLNNSSLTSLDAIINFCKANEISFNTVADGGVTNILISVNGQTYTSESGPFQITVTNKDSIEIRYNPNPPATPQPSQETVQGASVGESVSTESTN